MEGAMDAIWNLNNFYMAFFAILFFLLLWG